MKRFLLPFITLLACATTVSAQTVIYSEDFEGTSTFTLNTTDLGGDNSGATNSWMINNSYAGGLVLGIITIPATADEPAGLSSNPESNYMHICSAIASSSGVTNTNYLAASAATYFAAMNTSFSTTGYTNATLSFWWLCNGSAGTYGQVYYRTSAAGSWISLGSNYTNSTTWTHQIITNAALDNQPFIQLGFQFTTDGTGNDPGLAIDGVTVAGLSTTSTAPVASFTFDSNPVCSNSCVTATSTSTGTIDSFEWYVGPLAVAGGATTNSLSSCSLPVTLTAGTYTVTLAVFNTSGYDTESHEIVVTQAPAPVVYSSYLPLGINTLHAPTGETSYQWYFNGSPISGATADTFNFSTAGYYQVQVDSNGCSARSDSMLFTAAVAVAQVNKPGTKFIVAQTGTGAITLFASAAIDDAVTIGLYDVTGRKVLEGNWNKGKDNTRMDVSTCAPGMYIIKIGGNGGIAQTLKWIKE